MFYYYADGDYALIRVDVGAGAPTPEQFYAAPAQRYVGAAKGGWIESPTGLNLASEAVNSGDYYPVDEAEAQRVQAVIDAKKKKAATA
jgi:hypothetical protein